ncbi:Ig-like domain-containing protein [Empedobacter falsenii]|uniref:gliding motility protein GldB-related protein n=1 Tax=Empedobacter falsenii TaxID=343874 RepID=UPI002575B5C5|nr:Ig-like domain-containing protein [Empedobacter falsenii]MDM1297689.1 Ig-like domain-containing protein [Empedobacter falsenii]MDM1317681.1 Ig-like domain-containing protein [Empedobacter falsenii]
MQNKTLTLVLFIISSIGFAQKTNSKNIYTSDIDYFWVAYDSIQSTNDYSQKIKFINTLYIDKGTKGLKTFMKVRDYSDTIYVKLIDSYPKFWNSVRPNTLTIKNKTKELTKAVKKLKKLYPELKEGEMYFTIGGLRSGGTLYENMVLVGAEIATGTPKTNVSEFENDWLKNVFAKQSLDNIISLNIHEYVHTQQKPNDNNSLLHHTLKEGSCDFITELVLGEPIEKQYIFYGNQHFNELKKQFKEEMFVDDFSNWLYNGGQKGEAADLGYFIGYEICKSYYNQAKNKKQAIKDIIELNYQDEKEVENFLLKSGFYEEGFDKNQLLKEYEKKQPYIVKIEPFENGSTNVDSSIKEFRITFSKPMNPKEYSIQFSKKGKEYSPKLTKANFDNNNTTFVLSMELIPTKEYEFVISNGFKSEDGYALKLNNNELIVNFKTK